MGRIKYYSIIAGVNGVGKSSLSGVLKSERSDMGYIIDVDNIATKSKTDIMTAGRIALSKINEHLQKEISFSQETTLSGFLTEKTCVTAKKKGFAIRLFYVGLDSLDEHMRRIDARAEKGGHYIDAADVERRYGKRFIDLRKILPYCDEARFYDNEKGFVEIGEYKNGELFLKGDYRPAWIVDLYELVK